jgi:hypothetical protein
VGVAGATLLQLLGSGSGLTKRLLGPNNPIGFFLNGVEIRFAMDP